MRPHLEYSGKQYCIMNVFFMCHEHYTKITYNIKMTHFFFCPSHRDFFLGYKYLFEHSLLMCTVYELFYSSIIQRFFFFFNLDQFLHLHKCDPDSCAEAEVSGNGWQWYKPLHVRPEIHTQSKEQQFNIKVSMFDSQTIVQYLWISCAHATEIMHYCHVEIYELQVSMFFFFFFWHHEQFFTRTRRLLLFTAITVDDLYVYL